MDDDDDDDDDLAMMMMIWSPILRKAPFSARTTLESPFRGARGGGGVRRFP